MLKINMKGASYYKKISESNINICTNCRCIYMWRENFKKRI